MARPASFSRADIVLFPKIANFLNLKEVDWQGHEMNLAESETYTDWFLGINPRGLVPVLVWDGAVHIENNDILALLDQAFPGPRLIPASRDAEIMALLQHEDDLPLDLRTLSFRFVLGRTKSNKTLEQLARYSAYPATVGGVPDRDKREKERVFYDRLAAEGLSDAAVRAAAAKFRSAFDDLECHLSAGPYFLVEALSVMDIAWYVYATRLYLGGYPFAALHPRVDNWRETLDADERFARDVAPPPPLADGIVRNQADWKSAGTTMVDVVGF